MIIFEILGWIGTAALLLAYALVGWGRSAPSSLSYIGLNLLGAIGLAVNGIAHGAWPSTALNLLWLAIGLVSLARRGRRTEAQAPQD